LGRTELCPAVSQDLPVSLIGSRPTHMTLFWHDARNNADYFDRAKPFYDGDD